MFSSSTVVGGLVAGSRAKSWRHVVEGAGMSSTQESSCRQTETGWPGRRSRGGGKLRCSNGRG
eukprot:8806246-Pyramimonas_sp.AAC.1